MTQVNNHHQQQKPPPIKDHQRKNGVQLPKFYLDVNGRLQNNNSPRRPHSIAVAPSFNFYQAPKAPSVNQRRPLSVDRLVPNGGDRLLQPVPRRPNVDIKSSHIGVTSRSQCLSYPYTNNVPKSNSDHLIVGATSPFSWAHPCGTNPFYEKRSIPNSQSAPVITLTPGNGQAPKLAPAADYQLPKTPSLANSVMNMINESVMSQQMYESQSPPSYIPKSNSYNHNLGVGDTKQNRRLSLPVPNQFGGCFSPKPSPTFHGLPVSSNRGYDSRMDSGLFLGMSPSSTMSSTPNSVREALQHLLAQPRSGVDVLDGRMALFIDILDAQERFSQVVKYFVIRDYFFCPFWQILSVKVTFGLWRI